jgi:hypothetical protein
MFLFSLHAHIFFCHLNICQFFVLQESTNWLTTLVIIVLYLKADFATEKEAFGHIWNSLLLGLICTYPISTFINVKINFKK